MNQTTRTLLHVGCGPATKMNLLPYFHGDNWHELRVDINPDVKPDIVGTMLDMSAVPSGTADAVYSSHNIEHVYAHEVGLVLREFLRVLNDDGFLVITCPDLKSVAALVAAGKLIDTAYVSPAGPIAPIDILYGHRPPLAQGNHYMAHKCGFTLDVLMGCIKEAGFPCMAGAERPQAFDLWVVASKKTLPDTDIHALANTILNSTHP